MVVSSGSHLQGSKGTMVINEDGSIVSSTGELASNEGLAAQVVALLSHSFPLHVPHSDTTSNGDVAAGGDHDEGPHVGNGNVAQANAGQVWTWNRVTVDFGDHSYLACLSNRKIFVSKRNHVAPEPEAPQDSPVPTTPTPAAPVH